MRTHLVVWSVLWAGCTTPPSPLGESFKSTIKLESSTAGCPAFHGFGATLPRDVRVAVDKGMIGFDRATVPPYDIQVSDPDDDGRSTVEFTVGETWTTGTPPTSLAVTTAYVGTARYDELLLDGVVTFPAGEPLTASCQMTVSIWGFHED